MRCDDPTENNWNGLSERVSGGGDCCTATETPIMWLLMRIMSGYLIKFMAARWSFGAHIVQMCLHRIYDFQWNWAIPIFSRWAGDHAKLVQRRCRMVNPISSKPTAYTLLWALTAAGLVSRTPSASSNEVVESCFNTLATSRIWIVQSKRKLSTPPSTVNVREGSHRVGIRRR